MAPREVPNTKESFSKRDVCRLLVAPALRAAGWDESTQVREDVRLSDGTIHVSGQRFSQGRVLRADYVLYRQPAFPLAVIEVKSTDHPPAVGIVQALRYADLLNAPFIYSSNGRSIVERDRTVR